MVYNPGAGMIAGPFDADASALLEPASTDSTVTLEQGSVSGVSEDRAYFERQVIHKTFPKPQITKLDYKDGKISIKVEVTGDFLSDEWFWADFLQYFKLKVFIVPDLNSGNSDFEFISGFNDDVWSGKIVADLDNLVRKYDTIPEKNKKEVAALFKKRLSLYQLVRLDSVSLSELKDESNLLGNTYVFEEELAISKTYADEYFNKEGERVGFFARTFFDIQSFEREYLNTQNKLDSKPLTEENNSRWDMITFMTVKDVTGTGETLTNPVKIKAKVVSFTPEFEWSGSFKRSVGALPQDDEKIFFNEEVFKQNQGSLQSSTSDIEFFSEDFKGSNMYVAFLQDVVDEFLKIQEDVTE